MFHENALTLLASGITSQDAITTLLSLQSEEVDLALVLNTNLKQGHIQILIDRYLNQTDIYSPSGRIATLVASRLDLTHDHILKIITSGNTRMCHALMTRDEDLTTQFGTWTTANIIQQPWFSAQYAKALYQGTQLSDASDVDRFRKIYENHLAVNDWALGEFDFPMREFEQLSKEVDAVRQTHEYGFYFDDAPLNKHWQRVAGDIFREPREGVEEELLPELETELDIPTAIWLEDQMGEVDREFWEIFFPLLIGWERSLAELTTTTKSLVANRKALH